VVNHVLWGGTNTGVLNGMPATGRAFRNEAVVIDRFAGGVIVERREIGDLLGMMQQLGLIPGPQAA
jgi:predicted ester cyclase